MGALHSGHIALIQNCKSAGHLCVCSIFINPTQFNNKGDFKKYPVTLETDIDMLEEAGCDLLFLPSEEEIYPPGFTPLKYELGYLETVLEGTYRPGHFQGVCQVVDKLLSIIKPDQLFLGHKDYQQCMVIKKLVSLKNYNLEIKIVPTVRENNGLALSSRNKRLSTSEKQKALLISQGLFTIQKQIKPGKLDILKLKIKKDLEENGLTVDYIEIADTLTLVPLELWDGKTSIVALIAAWVNDVRLIDNLVLT